MALVRSGWQWLESSLTQQDSSVTNAKASTLQLTQVDTTHSISTIPMKLTPLKEKELLFWMHRHQYRDTQNMKNPESTIPPKEPSSSPKTDPDVKDIYEILFKNNYPKELQRQENTDNSMRKRKHDLNEKLKK